MLVPAYMRVVQTLWYDTVHLDRATEAAQPRSTTTTGCQESEPGLPSKQPCSQRGLDRMSPHLVHKPKPCINALDVSDL